MNNENPWKKLSGRLIYDNPWIRVEEHQVINPAGGQGIYGKVSFKNTAVGIVAVDDMLNIWLVGQYRYTLDAFSWEIPEGGAPLHEPPLAAARRELQEETGLIAQSWEEVLILHTSNSVTDEKAIVYLARDLKEGHASLEPTESDLVVKSLPLREAVDMVMDQQITDSISVAAILKVANIVKSS